MNKLVAFLTLITVLSGCQNPLGSETALVNGQMKPIDTMQADALIETNVSEPPQIEYPEFSISRTDFMLMSYISFSENELIKADRKSNIHEEWLFDTVVKTDTAEYLVYQIGHDVADEGSENQRFVTAQWVYLDTTKGLLYEYEVEDECLNKWTYEDNRQLFYPVYELSPKTTALVIPLSAIGERRGVLDSIFNDIAKSDGIYATKGIPKMHTLYDSSGYYKLLKSSKLEAAFRQYFDREFYVYGTEGYTKTKVKDIVYGLDQCMSNIFAFCFDVKSLKAIGHPVFCSDKLIDLNYGKDYSKIEKTIQDYDARHPADYSDSIRIKTFANVGEFYFTYNDDFLWAQKNNKSKCKFPSRAIYWADTKGSVDHFWADGLDLFGIPCN
jgi:hypothetical protein